MALLELLGTTLFVAVVFFSLLAMMDILIPRSIPASIVGRPFDHSRASKIASENSRAR
ncbi:hypothetical protein AWB73_02915 [Caballeronia turbans]|jgi:hypothetical protein|uniref:hypothetical protein n=1 Tax=Caballeronia sp. INML2 TaxID=2921748 RepID=UPI00074B7AC1|nr:hypothetical protein [Caballeronia sp. INML2]SAL32636.1 hypothetical protein AWB73_02915 [Caballeronia turbans]